MASRAMGKRADQQARHVHDGDAGVDEIAQAAAADEGRQRRAADDLDGAGPVEPSMRIRAKIALACVM